MLTKVWEVLQLVTLCLCVITDLQQLVVPCLGEEVLPAPTFVKLLNHLVMDFAQLYLTVSGKQSSADDVAYISFFSNTTVSLTISVSQ